VLSSSNVERALALPSVHGACHYGVLGFSPVKARRVAVVIISAVVVSLVTLSVGLVTNVASSQQRWPGWLAPLQNNPWGWFGGIAALAVVLAVVVPLSLSDLRREHGRSIGKWDLRSRMTRSFTGRMCDKFRPSERPRPLPPTPSACSLSRPPVLLCRRAIATLSARRSGP
jgi:hypothetical protein